jgi:hypothetical protein
MFYVRNAGSFYELVQGAQPENRENIVYGPAETLDELKAQGAEWDTWRIEAAYREDKQDKS